MSAFNQVCPTTIYTATNILSAANTQSFLTNKYFGTVPTYNPTGRTITINIRGTPYTANLFSITKMISEKITNRYSIPASGYWKVSSSSTLQDSGRLVDMYNHFLQTNIPGKTGTGARAIVLPSEATDPSPSLRGRLTGNVTDAVESVSYDLLYSLQYEYCFYAKILNTLQNDFINIQNTQTSEQYTGSDKDEQLRLIVNNMSSVRLRMNDLVEVAGYVGNAQTNQMSALTQRVNQFVTSTKTHVDELNANALKLFAKDKETGLRSRQLEFSEEKNAYANQLLALYGFANLIALGLLFYIYKS